MTPEYNRYETPQSPGARWPDGTPVSNWSQAVAIMARHEAERSEETTNVHRSIEILIGRLITDEGFRHAFIRDPHIALTQAAAMGLELTASEILALVATDRTLWDRVANQVDARLQKASLTNG